MRAFLDVDGVLANLVEVAFRIHNVPGNPYDLPENKGNWFIHEIAGISEKEFWTALDNFEFWATMPFMEDAFKILNLVEERFGEKNVFLLTAHMYTHHCTGGRHAWINKMMPDYKDRFFIGCEKYAFAHYGTVLIDDRDKNIKLFKKAGGRTITVPRPWNSLHEQETIPYLASALSAL